MNDTMDEPLERRLAEHASGIHRGPAAVIVVARARRQTRQRRMLGAGLAVVLAAGVAGLVPLLDRAPKAAGPAARDEVLVEDIGGGRSLVWREYGGGAAAVVCVVGGGASEACLAPEHRDDDKPGLSATSDLVLGYAAARFTEIRVTIGDAEPRPAPSALTHGIRVFALVGSTQLPGRPKTQAAITVTATAPGGSGASASASATLPAVDDGREQPRPPRADSLVTLQDPVPAEQESGLYGWTNDNFACLGWGEPKTETPTLEDLSWPAWCQRLPEGRTAVSLGWTDDPTDTTQIPWALNLLVPAQTTRVTIGGHVLKLRTVDDQTWAFDPANPFIADVQHAQVVVTGENGDVLWQGPYVQTALRGPMP